MTLRYSVSPQQGTQPGHPVAACDIGDDLPPVQSFDVINLNLATKEELLAELERRKYLESKVSSGTDLSEEFEC